MNHDLKSLCEWLRANKISLNASKTELLIFRKKQTIINKNLNFRISGQKLEPQPTVKYLGVLIDEHLTFQPHLKTLVQKLSRAVGMLAKIRHYVPPNTLRNIYFAIFNSHLVYGSQIWSHGDNALQEKIQILQNKALRITNFKGFREPANPLYNKEEILKICDNITIQNCLLVHDHQNGQLPLAFKNFVKLNHEIHKHITRISKNHLVIPTNKTLTFGRKSVTTKCVLDWNNMQNLLKANFTGMAKNELKTKLTKYFLSSYINN